MRYATSSTVSNSFIGTKQPLRGRLEVSETILSTIIGQWNEDPQSIFMIPIWLPSGHPSMENTGTKEKRIPITRRHPMILISRFSHPKRDGSQQNR
jgi:hypothetical protein